MKSLIIASMMLVASVAQAQIFTPDLSLSFTGFKEACDDGTGRLDSNCLNYQERRLMVDSKVSDADRISAIRMIEAVKIQQDADRRERLKAMQNYGQQPR
jgi:hypothetical protein